MAFPIPSHLPRKANPQDVSSKILSNIDQATYSTLNAKLASSWLAELNETIQATKGRIHDRIQEDIQTFERQLEASKSVKSRLQKLTEDVDKLTDNVSNSETGLVQTLNKELKKHSILTQTSANATCEYEALSHLLKCRNELKSLESLTQKGNLPEAMQACGAMESLLENAPQALQSAKVMSDIKKKFRIAKSSTEEQLSDAYSRSIVVLPLELIIHPSVQVRQSEAILSLGSILSSLSKESLSRHLFTLRRDLTSQFIDHVLKQPTFVSIKSDLSGHSLVLVPSPPSTENLITRLDNLSQVILFLFDHIFSSLPVDEAQSFMQTLIKPISSSLLDNLLVPSLPSSFGLLPPYLELLKRSVNFEEEIMIGKLGMNRTHMSVKPWANGICGHYERQRRVHILDNFRAIIVTPEDKMDRFDVEISMTSKIESTQPAVVPVQGGGGEDPKDDAWGFDEDSTSANVSLCTDDSGDGWGLDDDEEPEPETGHDDVPPNIDVEPKQKDGSGDPNPDEAWGWQDDQNLPPENDAQDDNVWDDDPWADPPPPPTAEKEKPIPQPVAKPATRLEKLASKNKKTLNGKSHDDRSLSQSPPSHTTFSPRAAPPPPVVKSSAKSPANVIPPLKLAPTPPPKEKYLVSGRVKTILKFVEETINEGKRSTTSSLFSSSTDEDIVPGSILLQAASSALDLYRALYPVVFHEELSTPERGMQFSNDCLYIGTELEKLEEEIRGDPFTSVRNRLSESKRCFNVLGNSWYEDIVEKQRQSVDEILIKGCQGFYYTGGQDRYDECETAIGLALREIRVFAQTIKNTLAKSKYYSAVGSVTDAALSRILKDILALSDIPEMESHRLSELCRILNALEGLFSEDPAEPSFVVSYVPSWLKYSYLSELLEASMADISYLFEEGALVDFDVDELVRLVEALFADTALRTNTINKILAGHPVKQEQ